ncbi:MAG: hypothetical protein R3F65_22045 [bacterium]
MPDLDAPAAPPEPAPRRPRAAARKATVPLAAAPPATSDEPRAVAEPDAPEAPIRS